jgi:hypothetical protein
MMADHLLKVRSQVEARQSTGNNNNDEETPGFDPKHKSSFKTVRSRGHQLHIDQMMHIMK